MRPQLPQWSYLLETRSGSNYQLSDSSVGGLWLWWAETAAPGDTEYNVNTMDRRQEGRGDMLHCTMGDTCTGTISPLRQPINYYETNVLIMQLELGRLDYQSAEASCVNSTLHWPVVICLQTGSRPSISYQEKLSTDHTSYTTNSIDYRRSLLSCLLLPMVIDSRHAMSQHNSSI